MLTALLLAALTGAAPPAVLVADAGVAAPHFQWTIPRAVETLDVPGESWAEGVPVRMQVVKSRERPEQILKDFLQAALAQGLHVPPPSRLPRSESQAKLTAYDPRTGIAHTVLLQPEPDGSVAVILANADMSRRQPKGKGALFLPLPPGALNPLQSRTEGAETLAFDLPAQGADPLEFYASELPRAGYQQTEPNVFRRGGEELFIRAIPPKPGQQNRGVVVIRRQAELPPEQFLHPGN